MTDPLRFVRRAYLWLALGTIAFTIYGSYVPFHFRPRPFQEATSAFVWTMQTRTVFESRSDGFANWMLGVPLGFGLLGALRAGRSNGVATALIGGCLVPVCTAFAAAVEFGQLFFPGRTCSGTDVIAQSLGALCGVLGWVLFGPWITERIRILFAGKEGPQRGWQFLAGYAGFVLFVQWLPLDFSISPHDIYRWMKRDYLKVSYFPFEELRSPAWRDGATVWDKVQSWLELALLFLPLGMLIRNVPWFRRWGNSSPSPLEGEGRPEQSEGRGEGSLSILGLHPSPRFELRSNRPSPSRGEGGISTASRVCQTFCRWWRVPLLALAFAFLSEAGQITVSRHPSSADVIVATFATLLGWCIAATAALAWIRSRRTDAAWVLAQLWLFTMILIHWQPFRWSANPLEFRREHWGWWPLPAQVSENYLRSLDKVILKFAIFVPLGILIAWVGNWAANGHAKRRAAILGGVAAAILEVGQSTLVGRIGSPTDILFGILGGWLGAAVAQQVVKEGAGNGNC